MSERLTLGMGRSAEEGLVLHRLERRVNASEGTNQATSEITKWENAILLYSKIIYSTKMGLILTNRQKARRVARRQCHLKNET